MKKNLTSFSRVLRWSVIGLSFCVLALVFNALHAQSYPYTSVEGKYKVTFLQKPETGMEPGESANTYKASATVKGITYFVGYTHHTVDVQGSTTDLAQVSVDAFNETIKGEIESQTTWNLKGHKGYDVHLTIPEKHAKIWYKVALVGQFQYQLVVISSEADWNQKTISKFMKSFKLVK